MNMGVIGLGIGTLAAYGREGDRIVFYEIDPEVARIATDPSYFTYLEDSRARIEIVLGDARLSLESELQGAGSRKFDLLVIDAFSSDSIPLHLLTREAFKLYDQHLRRNGVLAVHISNRHLLLGPMVLRLGSDLRMKGFRILNQTSKAHRSGMSIWVILTRSEADLNQLAKIVNTHRSRADGSPLIFLRRTDSDRLAKIPVWTDDFSNIWNVMKPVWRGARAQ
jgi:spermidine synthase